jgi:hypothetical protein
VDAPNPGLPRAGVVDYRLLGRTREDELTDLPAWYHERPEPEERVRGTISPRAGGPTPGGRDRLLFALVRPGAEDLPIYGPAAEAALGAAAGMDVEIAGKRIDRRRDGLGMELWVAEGGAVRAL